MIKNNIHYQLTGSIISDFGMTINNPVIKISTNTNDLLKDQLLKCEYNIYLSIESYNNGDYFFKAKINNQRLKNIEYSITNIPDFSFNNYKEFQKNIISETFNIPINNITLIEE